MLSINIPVYNIKVTELVLDLKNQAEKLNIPFEIRVYDDGSQLPVKRINRKLADEMPVVYIELDKNVGRAAIRNQMGKDAKYKYLLFIDADSKLVNNHFLKSYMDAVNPGCVLCGGTVYESQQPVDPAKLLRWMYGKKREAISAEKRNSAKGFIITSNNFCIEKEVFGQVHFRENVKNYGHEDTLLGYDLFIKGIEIKHINNPVEHTGLENAEAFLEKTKTALGNLKVISKDWLKDNHIFASQVGFLHKYNKITRLIPPATFKFIYKTSRVAMEKNLTGKHPRMFWFDLYKICYYSNIKNR